MFEYSPEIRYVGQGVLRKYFLSQRMGSGSVTSNLSQFGFVDETDFKESDNYKQLELQLKSRIEWQKSAIRDEFSTATTHMRYWDIDTPEKQLLDDLEQRLTDLQNMYEHYARQTNSDLADSDECIEDIRRWIKEKRNV